MDMNSSSDMWFANIYFHSVGCIFTISIMFFDAQKFSILVKSNLCFLSFLLVLLVSYLNIFAKSVVLKIYLFVLSKSFKVLASTLKFVIHFELLFLCGVRKEFNFNLLYMDSQLIQHHLLKRLFFPPLKGVDMLVKNKLTVYVCFYFWNQNSIPLISMFIFMLVPHYFDNHIL